jgi:hypothetical protein
MAIEKLILLSGISLIIGGLLATAGFLSFARFDPNRLLSGEGFWLPFNFLIIGGGFFMALGLPGFYASQAQKAGVVGLVGYVIFFAGIVFAYLAVHSIETMTMPNVPKNMMIIVSFAAPSLLIGGLLTAVTIWRAGVYSPWLAVALIGAGFLGLLGQFMQLPGGISRDIVTALFTITMALIGTDMVIKAGSIAQTLR